jgi:hypothetical protein
VIPFTELSLSLRWMCGESLGIIFAHIALHLSSVYSSPARKNRDALASVYSCSCREDCAFAPAAIRDRWTIRELGRSVFAGLDRENPIGDRLDRRLKCLWALLARLRIEICSEYGVRIRYDRKSVISRITRGRVLPHPVILNIFPLLSSLSGVYWYY